MMRGQRRDDKSTGDTKFSRECRCRSSITDEQVAMMMMINTGNVGKQRNLEKIL